MFRAYQQPIIRRLNAYMENGSSKYERTVRRAWVERDCAVPFHPGPLTVYLEIPFAIHTFNFQMMGCCYGRNM
jgi:hypothetical protein